MSLYRVIIKYVEFLGGVEEYKIEKREDILVDTLVIQLRDARCNLHTFNKAYIESIMIEDYTVSDNIGMSTFGVSSIAYDKFEGVEMFRYVCNYGGTDSALVYAVDEKDALTKYVLKIQKTYSGAKIDECNCILSDDLAIII